MRVLVTGTDGLLGCEVVAEVAHRGWHAIGLGRSELDVTAAGAVSARVVAEAPDWVIHCAAYTGVDKAEEEPDVAMHVNRDGSANVAAAARSVGAGIVYVSTDYVFDGQKQEPYLPGDPVAPLSAYGQSKLAGERAVQAAVAGAGGEPPLIVRTGWLYGSGGRNFISAILDRAVRGESLRVVADQRGRPTWAKNLALGILDLAERGAGGVWHVADAGEATWLDLAREAVTLRGLDVEVGGVTSEEWGAAAERPTYSVLDLAATEVELGRPMMNWREALRCFLDG